MNQTHHLYEVINMLCADDYNQLLGKMKLNHKTINEAADALHRIIFREKSSQEHLVKYGKTSRGRQRYFNKTTGKTESDTSASIVRYTKKSYEQWSSFIKYMLYGLSLKAIALEVGISKTTAFAWRHKVIEAIKNYQEVIQLSGEIQADETYFLLNMKGPWKKKSMPRDPKKKGGPGIYRGVSNEQVCVFVAIDENDQVITKIIGQGNPLKENLQEPLQGKVQQGSHFTTDSKSAYRDIIKDLGCALTQIPSGLHVKDEYSLGLINQYHSELKTWFKRFRGVSTKHLENYLMWFRFMKYLNYQLPSNHHAYESLKYAISSDVLIRTSDIHRKSFPVDIFKPYQHLSQHLS
ncbi:MAG: IS1595 family transposase [Acholeplasmataceae bacterium]|nr:IS1595 family transposase [Acholeplasmataceae bacterium]